MKRLFLISLLFLVGVPLTVHADFAEMFTTPDLKQCWIDRSAGELTVFVTHGGAGTFSLDAVRFRLVTDPGLHAIYVGETLGQPPMAVSAVGNTQDGIIITGYFHDNNETGALLIAVHYVLASVPDPCAGIRFGGHPDSTVDDFEYHDPNSDSWIRAHISRSTYTWGGGSCSYWCLLSTPVKQSTWGSVKALYR